MKKRAPEKMWDDYNSTWGSGGYLVRGHLTLGERSIPAVVSHLKSNRTEIDIDYDRSTKTIHSEIESTYLSLG